MSLKKWIVLLAVLALFFSLAACSSIRQAGSIAADNADAIQKSSTELKMMNQLKDLSPEPDQPDVSSETENDTGEPMHLAIGNTEVSVAWEDNESVDALIDLVKTEPVIVEMSMYGGFEQVGSLGSSILRNDVQTETQSGDIVLYAGNQIVIFYGSNSWAYTRLGRIIDKTDAELEAMLGNGNVTVTISYGR